MEKRTLLAVGICMGILLLWWQIFPPPKAQAPVPTPVAEVQPAAGQAAPVAPTGSAPSGAPAAAGAAAVPAEKVEQVTLESTRARYVFSNAGAGLRSAILKDAKFLNRAGDPTSGVDIVAATDEAASPLRMSFANADFPMADRLVWSIKSRNADSVVFRTETADVAIEKRIRLAAEPFQLAVELEVENRGTKPANHALSVHVPGRQDPAKKGGGFFTMGAQDLSTLVCLVDGKVERGGFEAVLKEPVEKGGVVRWIAADTKYYGVALIPHRETPAQLQRCSQRASGDMAGEATLSFDKRTVAPGAKTLYAFSVFAGPKVTEALDQVRPGGEDVELGQIVDLTLAWLARPLIAMLKLFQSWVGNWGLAIIMLTLFVKIVTFYPTQRAMVSGKRMAKLQPKVKALQDKFAGDRQRLGLETMNLYKAHGVSPLGGCLPTLITMPIWFALFSSLNYAVELHRTPFIGYIHDLSARDPFFVAPLLMGVIMFFQMRMSPAGTDPAQQKMMSMMMPVMFTAFSLFLPAGLAIYTLTNSLLAITQQVLVNRMTRGLEV